MTRIFWSIIAFVVFAGQSLFAQSVSLTMEPKHQTIKTGTAFFNEATIKLNVAAAQGFVGPVTLAGYCTTLTKPGEEVTVDPGFMNLPYDEATEVTVKVAMTNQSTGTHEIVVRATLMNGTWFEESVKVTLEKEGSSAWSIYQKRGILYHQPTAIAVDRKRGIGWSASSDGLERFDGTEWTSIPWPDAVKPYVNPLPARLVLDGSGDVWVLLLTSSNTGYTPFYIAEYTPDGWEVHVDRASYSYPDSDLPLTYGQVNMWINQDDEAFILATNGLWRYANDSLFTLGAMEGTFSNLVVDRKGNVWVEQAGNVHSNNGLMRFNSKGEITFWRPATNEPQKIVEGLVVSTCFPIGVDHDNNLYLRINERSYSQAMVRLDENLTPTKMTTGYLSQNFTSIALGENNSMWVALSENGLARFDGTDWWHYTTENSELPSNTVLSVHVDENNAVWIETESYLVLLDGNASPGTTFREAATSVEGSIEEELTFNVTPNPVTTGSTIRITIPNPAMTGSAAHLSLESAAQLRIRLINALGEEITVLSDAELGAGDHSIPLRTDGLYPGLYFVHLTTRAGIYTRPVIVVR